ncbi:MAG: hypothetical protein ACLU80_15205 [Dorea sp.]
MEQAARCTKGSRSKEESFRLMSVDRSILRCWSRPEKNLEKAGTGSIVHDLQIPYVTNVTAEVCN